MPLVTAKKIKICMEKKGKIQRKRALLLDERKKQDSSEKKGGKEGECKGRVKETRKLSRRARQGNN